jgi:hypothetical protein
MKTCYSLSMTSACGSTAHAIAYDNHDRRENSFPKSADLTASRSVSQNPAPTARIAGHVTSRRSSPAAASCDANVSTCLVGPVNASDGTCRRSVDTQVHIEEQYIMLTELVTYYNGYGLSVGYQSSVLPLEQYFGKCKN